MQQTGQTPTFNMKAVVRETGIRPDTLRAWERRYELPHPERTAGGHRIYSQRDVDILKWLMARQEEGLSISHAAELFKRIEAESQDPLAPGVLGKLIRSTELQASAAAGDLFQQLREKWLAACCSFDGPAAERISSEAFALFPAEQVCAELLQKSLAALGRGWYEGTVTVQQEHFASAQATRRLDALLAAAPPPAGMGRVLLGCPPEEEHTFGLKLLAVLLGRRGMEVVYLGANVPAEKLASTLDAVRPRLAVFSAQQLISAAQLQAIGSVVADRQVPMAFGGRIFVQTPSVQQSIQGHYLGDNLSMAAAHAERLAGRGELSMPVGPLPGEYTTALNHITTRKAALEAALTLSLAIKGQSSAPFFGAGDNLTRNVMAALKLGNLELVNGEVEWVAGLLSARKAAPGLLETYLAAYRQALMDTLDHRGQIIIDWFDGLIGPRRPGSLQFLSTEGPDLTADSSWNLD
jgi:DNA-binding transcriptional MerR regulator/methylmalonyl-CoA mutase cobalamin-binding subunit